MQSSAERTREPRVALGYASSNSGFPRASITREPFLKLRIVGIHVILEENYILSAQLVTGLENNYLW